MPIGRATTRRPCACGVRLLMLAMPTLSSGSASCTTRAKDVPQDYAAAAAWYRRAAEQGNQFAQFNLGVMYEIGQGVPQDYVLAHMWFNLAAVQNHIDAIKNRDLVSAKMTPAQIADAWRQAREWKPKPAQ
jgi:uncharacterized protein